MMRVRLRRQRRSFDLILVANLCRQFYETRLAVAQVLIVVLIVEQKVLRYEITVLVDAWVKVPLNFSNLVDLLGDGRIVVVFSGADCGSLPTIGQRQVLSRQIIDAHYRALV